MRRIVEYVRDYWFELINRVANGWCSFWFTPVDPASLGLIRVLTGLMLVYTHAVWGLQLKHFFGPDGWMGASALRSLQSGQFIFSYLWYVPPSWLGVAHGAAMIVLVLFTIGLFTRVTSILSFFILINYAHRAPAALFGLDQINAMLTMYLAIGPSGASLSVDRLVARYRETRQTLEHDSAGGPRFERVPSIAANISLRLIQVHLCVIYLFAGMSKLLGEAWWDGTAIWRAAASYEYQSVDLTWLAYTPLLANILTNLAAFLEISYCALIWPKLTRPLVLVGAVLMHMAIGVCMGMMTFGLIMLIGNISFVCPNLIRELVSVLSRGRRRLTVLYDGTCQLCIRSMSIIKALDIGGQIRLVDFNRIDPQTFHPLLTLNACLAAMQVIVKEPAPPRLFAGYWGSSVIARTLPLLWPLVPFFSIPGAGKLGPLLYQAIARNRARRLGCYAGTCVSHSGAIVGLTNPVRTPVTLTIRLPEDAKLFVQDRLYPGEGRTRRFVSTPARHGKDYVFNLRVEVVRDSVKLSMSQQVRLRAGQHTEIKFALEQPSQPSDPATGNGRKTTEPVVASESTEPCSIRSPEEYEVQV